MKRPPREQGLKDLEQGREAIRVAPAEPGGYRLLEQLFSAFDDAPRSELMKEIADALESRALPTSASRLPLRPLERAGLRHPSLRRPEGELLHLAGPVLMELLPRVAGAPQLPPFEADAGPGAVAVHQALTLAAQVLDLPSLPAVVVRSGPATLELRLDDELGISVRKDALETPWPQGVLRFDAGAALFAQQWDLAALWLLGPDALEEGLAQLGRGMLHEKSLPPAARAQLEGMDAAARERLKDLLGAVDRPLDLKEMRVAARASTHRAGLVIAGSVAPALAALRLANAGSAAQAELLRFAASERFLKLRQRTGAFPSSSPLF